jgi:hypothetical protein
MRFFPAPFLALATLAPALFLVVVVPGCAKQSEGERCGDSSGPSNNDDCEDGLTCKAASSLLNSNGGHRCCYSDGHVTDSRCEPSTEGPAPVAGAGGRTNASAGGSGETGGGGSAGNGVAGGSTEQAGAAEGS